MSGPLENSLATAASQPLWPRKVCEIQNHTIDSTRWNDFRFRDGDIVTVTWAKTGTTWVQQILSQLIFCARTDIPVMQVSPWVEHRAIPKRRLMRLLEAQTHRRFVKSHLQLDALVFAPRAQYLYIGRDGRDAMWSWYQHHLSLSPAVYQLMNHMPGRVGPPLGPAGSDPRQYFHDWLDRDGYPLWPFWSHIQSWWDARQLPNVMLLHFNELKADLAFQITRIAEFLGLPISERLWPQILRHCSFDFMKHNARSLSPLLEQSLAGGAGAFVNVGSNGRWREVLCSSDVEKYEECARRHLTPECAHWLATGERADR